MTSPADELRAAATAQTRKRCGMPCLTHPHDCDRSPGHTGVHRDVQQKGDHTCEWATPGPQDIRALTDRLSVSRSQVKGYHRAWETARGDRDRLAGFVDRLRELAFMGGQDGDSVRRYVQQALAEFDKEAAS